MNRIPIILCILLSMNGCELSDSSTIEPEVSPSLIKSVQIQDVTVNTDTIIVNGAINPDDILTLSTVASATLYQIGNATEVTVRITDRDGNDEYGSGTLYNNGIHPDGSLSDSTFSGVVSYSIQRSVIGELRAVFETNHLSNKVILPITILRKNSPPSLTNLSVADTVTLDELQSLIFISVMASDSDGIANIKAVQFNSFLPNGSPSSGNPFQMYDDGGSNNAGGNTDQIAGDGVYSLTIILPANTPKGTYRFEFEARDFSNTKSNVIIHQLVVQ